MSRTRTRSHSHSPGRRRREPAPPTGQAAAVEAALRSGALRRPGAAQPSFVDLICAVHRGAGAEVTPSAHCETVAEHLFARRHLLLVLVDGMGMSALAHPDAADLRSRLRLELDSVFPATTACAMTTVATGKWPAQHGVPGWWAYLEEHATSATVLPFRERHSGRGLRRRGVRAADVWPLPSRFAEASRSMEMRVPLVYVLSTFSRYLSGNCRTRGYLSLRHAQRRILRRLRKLSARGGPPTITYWYIPDYDSACHTYGVAGAQSRATLRQIQDLLLELAAAAPDDAVVAATADHGLMDLEEGDRAPLFPGDPLLECLRCAPTGEGRTPHFHVRPGKAAELAARVADRAGDRLALLSQAEADDLRLFGPDPLSPLARQRFGDYIGIALAPFTLAYYPSADSTALHHVGVHGGMSPAEVRIPLLVL